MVSPKFSNMLKIQINCSGGDVSTLMREYKIWRERQKWNIKIIDFFTVHRALCMNVLCRYIGHSKF